MNTEATSNSVRFISSSFWAILLLSLASVPALAATGQVDVDTEYQQLEGFGAAGAWYEGWVTAHPKKNELYYLFFQVLGLDIYRVRNTYDYDSGYISRSGQIVKAAKTRNPNIKVMISSWSPPDYLKSTGSTVGGTLKKDAGGYMYEEFAQWWAGSLAEFASEGMVADYVNMQNEPDYVATWDSCKFTYNETASWAGYNLAFEALYDELNGMDNFPKLLAPEACNTGGSVGYINALIDKSHVYGYAHHYYGDGDPDNPDTFIPQMQNFASLYYGEKPLMQTEFSHDTETHDDTMDLAVLMHNALTVEGVSAYLYWDLFWGGSGGLVTIPSYGSSSYAINPVFYAFMHYSAFTDPNWYRVGASTNSGSLRISAFKNPDCTELSIIIINVSAGSISLSLSLGDFNPTSSEVYQTDPTEDAAYIGPFTVPIELTGESITTINLTGSCSPYSNCAEVKAADHRLTSDIAGDGDCYVNYEDLAVIIDYWPTTSGCGGMSNCDGADFEPDGDVDFADFSTFGLQWLYCNNPEDASCTPNW
jgi:glucuronoarabinoxylan endo-1,4-beta-xylanase